MPVRLTPFLRDFFDEQEATPPPAAPAPRIAATGPTVPPGARERGAEALDWARTLPVSTRTRNTLCRIGVTSFDELTSLSRADLEAVRNIGAHTLREIDDLLAANALTLRADDEPRPSTRPAGRVAHVPLYARINGEYVPVGILDVPIRDDRYGGAIENWGA